MKTSSRTIRVFLSSTFLDFAEERNLLVKKVFPELEFKQVPFSHPIYHQNYQFNNGLPKVHEHDGKPAVGYGLFFEGRLICFYDYECDLGNGWEDAELYNDAPEIREKALQMGANLIQFAFTLK